MFDSTQLMGFTAAAAVLIVIPGPNTMLILAHTMSGGRSAGLATALGVETGTLVHTVAAALGLSAVLSTSVLAFDAVKYVGAAYLAWLGLRALLGGDEAPPESSPKVLGPWSAYWRAVLTNVLNPKAALFFLALLPQFVRPERGHVVLQFLALGLIVVVMGLSFGSALAVLAATVSARLREPGFARWQRRLTGTVLLGLGVRLALARRG
jgi:threonine/homoserine/homoserine lactone efflux protein